MGRVLVYLTIPVIASEAETLWYDQTRWPSFIDGYAHTVKQDGDWPQAGSSLTWTSSPGGRGQVLEDVVRYEARVGQESLVEDEKIRGRQRVAFEPQDDGVRVTLELQYEIKGDQFLKPAFDFFFVQRPMRESMHRTLVRFRREVLSDREPV